MLEYCYWWKGSWLLSKWSHRVCRRVLFLNLPSLSIWRDGCFNKRLVFQWIRIVLCYSPDLFLHAYEADFIQGLLNKNERKLARSFNFPFRYIDDVLSLNNPRFGDFVDRIYPIELEIKVCLIRIMEQVGEKRSTTCTHRYADCLLKNTFTKDNKYAYGPQCHELFAK
jgi:hypothetical protein